MSLSDQEVDSFDGEYPNPQNMNTNRDSQIQPLARSREVHAGAMGSNFKRSTIDNLREPKRSMK